MDENSRCANAENKNTTKQEIMGANKECRLEFDFLLLYSLAPSLPRILIVYKSTVLRASRKHLFQG